MSKPSKKKQQKSRVRERKLRKMRNVRCNNTMAPMFYLEALIDGAWMYVKDLRSKSSVDAYVKSVEAMREAGDVILEARVRDKVTGRPFFVIPASGPKGTLPDKMTQESAKKAVL